MLLPSDSHSRIVCNIRSTAAMLLPALWQYSFLYIISYLWQYFRIIFLFGTCVFLCFVGTVFSVSFYSPEEGTQTPVLAIIRSPPYIRSHAFGGCSFGLTRRNSR